MTHKVQCILLKESLEGLAAPPCAGKLGERIYQHVSKQAWGQWLAHQTMLINENQLSLIDPEAKTFLQQEMEKFFFGEGSAKPAGYTANTDKNPDS